MARFFLYSKENTAKEIRNNDSEDIKPIPKDIWIDTIENDIDCVWYANTPLGKSQLEVIIKQNISEEEIKENFLFREVFCFADKKREYSDFIIDYVGYKVYFQFPRITKQRLEKMKELANKLDCYLVENYSIVDDTKYEKLLAKTK